MHSKNHLHITRKEPTKYWKTFVSIVHVRTMLFMFVQKFGVSQKLIIAHEINKQVLGRNILNPQQTIEQLKEHLRNWRSEYVWNNKLKQLLDFTKVT